jgi:hypothetical protein
LLYSPKTDLIICRDININYLEESNRVKELNALLKNFNLVNTITFPTRICRSTNTAIDNIFMDTSKDRFLFVSSLHNGFSDHEGQLLTIDLPLLYKNERHTYSYRKINNFTIADFQIN